MSSSILIFAGPADEAALRVHAFSIGLQLLHPFAASMTDIDIKKAFQNPIQGGFFSFLPLSDLHPVAERDGLLYDVIDPLIDYVRPHYIPPYLVAGQVLRNTDVPELAAQTKAYFLKLRKWVRENWRRREEDRYFIGPDAERILREEGARIAYLPPNVKVETKWIE